MVDRPTGPEEPELPALRRFKFPEGAPGKPDTPVEPVLPPPADRPGESVVPEAEISDTFDENELVDESVEPASYDAEYDDAATTWMNPLPPATSGHFGAPAAPMPPPPRTGPVPTWSNTGPGTGRTVVPPPPVEPPAPAKPSRRTPLIVAAIAAVVALAVVGILVFRPFDSEPSAGDDRGTDGSAQTPPPAEQTPSESRDQTDSEQTPAPTVVPGGDSTFDNEEWASSFCSAMGSYTKQATSLTSAIEGAVLNLSDLQVKARILLSSLDSSLSELTPTGNPSATTVQNDVQTTVKAGVKALEPSQPESSPSQTKTVLTDSLAAPGEAYATAYQDVDAATQTSLDAQSSCAELSGGANGGPSRD